MDLIPPGMISCFFCVFLNHWSLVCRSWCPPKLCPRVVFLQGEVTPVAFSLAVAVSAVSACSLVHCDPATILMKLTSVFVFTPVSFCSHATFSLSQQKPWTKKLLLRKICDLLTCLFVVFVRRATPFLSDLQGNKWGWRSSGPVCSGRWRYGCTSSSVSSWSLPCLASHWASLRLTWPF